MLTDAQITDIRNAQTRAHRQWCDAMVKRKLLTKRKAEDIHAGFKDGCAAMVASCKAAEKAGKGARVVWNRERAEWMGL